MSLLEIAKAHLRSKMRLNLHATTYKKCSNQEKKEFSGDVTFE